MMKQLNLTMNMNSLDADCRHSQNTFLPKCVVLCIARSKNIYRTTITKAGVREGQSTMPVVIDCSKMSQVEHDRSIVNDTFNTSTR